MSEPRARRTPHASELPKGGRHEDATELADQAESLFRAFRVVRRRVLARPIGMSGLPGAHVELLNLVRRYPGVRTRDAAQRLRLASNTVSTLAGHLEGAGLLERGRDPTDGRGVRFYLTPAAAGELAGWRDQRLALLAQALSDLDTADQVQITAALPALDRLVAAVRAHAALPQPPQTPDRRRPSRKPSPAARAKASRRSPRDRPPPTP